MDGQMGLEMDKVTFGRSAESFLASTVQRQDGIRLDGNLLSELSGYD